MFSLTRGHIALFILLTASLLIYFISVSATRVMSSEEKHLIKNDSFSQGKNINQSNEQIGKNIIINLTDMRVELYDGSSTISTFSIVSKGKPGSYYETPGGIYKNDYKEATHFSSIGHVYMPWSVHIFGNFFIHGIPYHEDGTRVSSTYSGGCIRLKDEDAQKVYDFADKETNIIIKQQDQENFSPSKNIEEKIISQDMTNYMTAVISLEFLTQDDEIYFDNSTTTRRKLLNNLINEKNLEVANTYASYYGNDLFIEIMNEKAKSIGLNNTHFNSVVEGAETTESDYKNFLLYIKNYKSYLLEIKK